ncbi:hypothetical protein AB1Y20_002676 [Prymnesium parvum]|uniref:Pr1-like protein n=1 Tax=Prymnesium parvum TaxID=97485 RepID=A0AB34JA01_PRYPA
MTRARVRQEGGEDGREAGLEPGGGSRPEALGVGGEDEVERGEGARVEGTEAAGGEREVGREPEATMAGEGEREAGREWEGERDAERERDERERGRLRGLEGVGEGYGPQARGGGE